MGGEPARHGVDGKLRGLALRVPEHARADAAKRDGTAGVRLRGLEAARVAAGELCALQLAWCALHDGPYGMHDVACGQVEGVGHLCRARRFLVSLCLHELGALFAQLDASKGVDRVVDAVVAGHPAAEHLRVGGVHDGGNF